MSEARHQENDAAHVQQQWVRAIELGEEQQQENRYAPLEGVTVNPDGARQLRIAAIVDADAELHAPERDRSGERKQQQRVEAGVQGGDRGHRRGAQSDSSIQASWMA